MLGGCEDELDLVQDEMVEAQFELSSTMVATPIYRGPGPLPKY